MKGSKGTTLPESRSADSTRSPADEIYTPTVRAGLRPFEESAAYEKNYERSVRDPQNFWAEQARALLTWDAPWRRVLDYDYRKAHIHWFDGGRLNVSVNCVDRHLAERAQQTAILWEGNQPGDVRRLTYAELHELVCRSANVLRTHGVQRGDRVVLYMPMVPELAAAMLACARIGAVHSVVFAGFSARALRGRIEDSGATIVLTADYAYRGEKVIALKEIVDEALVDLPQVRRVLVLRRDESRPCAMRPDRDLSLHDELTRAAPSCPPESMEAEAPLFTLYTSGSTGKPKGALHTQAGYLLYAAFTHRHVFNYRDGDIYFCAADLGWVTGHSYIVYGPLANGATTMMFEGLPTYPDAGRYWDMIDRHQVNSFYTAPTAIRAVAKEGDAAVDRYKLDTLKVIGSVGEPINRDAWLWYYRRIGKERCPVVDTWWQTETGGILISPLPGVTKLKPGSATRPLFGIQPCIVDEEGKELEGNDVKGLLCIKFPWPGQMRTVFGDHQRFIDTYFSRCPGMYFTGDAAIRDRDGYYWITGRVDDVLNVSGHRLGTAEIESAIVQSGVVAEAAVVGMPHEIKGIGIYAFCILRNEVTADDSTRQAVSDAVRRVIGAIAIPDKIQFVPGLPKTRSGKIMRRILRKIAEGERENFGDITTLADPAVVQQILDGVQNGS